MKIFLKKSWPFFLLAILSFSVHFAFLSYPAQVVFDEVHFGKFVAAYFTGQYYFDIHPPLGKLMIAGVAKIAGINSVFAFEKIGESVPAQTLFWLRFLPAFFGSLFTLFFAWLAYLLGRSKKIALVAGLLVLLDNAFLAQSKFILVDIFLLSFEALTLCFFLLWQRQKSYSAKWFFYVIATGLFFGLTVSIKWTGLAIIGILGIILLIKIFSRRLQEYLNSQNSLSRWQNTKESLLGLVLLAAVGLVFYPLPFYVHFKILNLPGPGDAFMSQEFQTELKYGRENVDQPLPFITKLFELNKTMLTANASITTEHPFGSRWFTWPMNHKPVYYWNKDLIDKLPEWKAKIYFSGNFLLWWLGLLSLAIIILKNLTRRGRQKTSPVFYLLLVGFMANLLPFILIKRVAFLYHYLPAAIYINLFTALLLGNFWPKNKKLLIAVLGLILLSFLIIAPLSYGWPMPPALNNFEVKLMAFFS